MLIYVDHLSHLRGNRSSFIGVILVSVSDSSAASPDEIPSAIPLARKQPLVGDVLALLSALFYAFYVTLLKARIGDEDRIDMQLFFGFVGLFNIIGLWPVGLLLHLTGAEPFELPKGNKVVGAVLINVRHMKARTPRLLTEVFSQMMVTLSSDYMYVLAMLKTTPVSSI
jgi:solute carrier family 35, member F5